MHKTEFANHLLHALTHRKIRPLLQTRDEYGEIFVYEQSGRRVLTFDERFEQSAMHLQQPCLPSHRYVRAMLMVLAFCTPSKVLHLGLGGGALVRALAALQPDCQHIAVELRASVKHIAEQYFLTPDTLPDNTQLRVVCDDARRFIRAQPTESFDIIFSDIYLANGMDVSQKSCRYLADCAAALSNSGWLVLNFTRLPAFDDPSFLTLEGLFEEILIASVDAANYVIFASKRALPRPLAAYAPAIKELSQQLNIDLLRQFKHLMQCRDFFQRP